MSRETLRPRSGITPVRVKTLLAGAAAAAGTACAAAQIVTVGGGGGPTAEPPPRDPYIVVTRPFVEEEVPIGSPVEFGGTLHLGDFVPPPPAGGGGITVRVRGKIEQIAGFRVIFDGDDEFSSIEHIPRVIAQGEFGCSPYDFSRGQERYFYTGSLTPLDPTPAAAMVTTGYRPREGGDYIAVDRRAIYLFHLITDPNNTA